MADGGRYLWPWLVVFVVVVAMPVAAVSLTNSTPVQGGVPIGAADGPLVTFMEPADGEANLRDPWVDANTLQYNSTAGNMTVSSNGPTTATVDQLEGQWSNASEIDTNGTELTFNPGDKQAVSVGGGVEAVEWQATSAVAVDDGTTDFRYAAGSEGYVVIGTLPANSEFEARTAGGTPIETFTTDGSGRANITVPTSSETGVQIVDTAGPTIVDADPDDGAGLRASNTTLYADVVDPTFATAAGDTVTVEFTLNGAVVNTQQISSNQTVSADVEPPLSETSTWSVTVTDEYGQSDTIAQRSFQTPAELRIYEETDPDDLIDDASVNFTVRFFPLSSSSGDVVTRAADGGVVNLTDLPADNRFVVTVEGDGNYTYRRIVIDSLYETSRIYLLNETQPNSEVVFDLQDPTGSFPPEETILYVEKPITRNNTTAYRTIAGDTFGASGAFPAVLQDDARYRLRVETADGENERILGFYSVYGSTRETLLIQRIEPAADNRSTGIVYGGLENTTGNTQLAVRFSGGTNTTEVSYTVTNASGGVIVPTTTTTASSFAHVYDVNASGRYNVSWTVAYEDGNTRSGNFYAGQIDGVADRLNIDPMVLSIMSWIAILATMGLVVIVDPKLSPAAGTGMATALTIIGTVAIPAPMLGVSGAISVLTLFGGNQ